MPERVNQTDVSTAWPITEQWRLLGRWHYDIHNKRSNEVSMGMEQQGCCTAVRIFISHFLRPYDNTLPNANAKRQYMNAIFFQFIFKGFAGVGQNKIDQTLKTEIPDYNWHRDNF